MLRVLETIDRSSFSTEMIFEKVQLTLWIDEILTSTWLHQVSFHRVDTFAG